MWSLLEGIVNTLRLRQNRRHFADDIFKWIFLNENVQISIRTSLKFVPRGPINNIPALVQIMAWRRPGDKPLSEPMIIGLLRLLCVTRPQWFDVLLYTLLGHNVMHLIIPLVVQVTNLTQMMIYSCWSLDYGIINVYSCILHSYIRFPLPCQTVNTRWWEIDIRCCYSRVKIAFAPICTCKNDRRIWCHNTSASHSHDDVTDQL